MARDYSTLSTDRFVPEQPAGVVRQTGRIPQRLADLIKLQILMSGRMDELMERLQPILRKSEPAPGDKCKAADVPAELRNIAPLDSELLELINRSQHLLDKIDSTLERVEL